MKTVAVAPGEGVGPEIVAATTRVIDAMNLPIRWDLPLVGEPALAQGLPALSDEARARFVAADATLFGASSGPSGQIIRLLRWGFQTYANVRPARWTPGRRSPLARPEGIDFVIVRENLEDSYIGVEGDLPLLAPLELAGRMSGIRVNDLPEGRFALKVITRRNSEQISRFAFELARRRKARGGRERVLAAAKYNVMPYTDGLFVEVAREVAQDYPDIAFDTVLADDFAHRMVVAPQSLDVVVMPNLFGDIFSDEAAALIGGLGLAPSGCYGAGHAYFESIHGTAPDIAGKGVANPTATLLSAGLMLEYLGFDQAANALSDAVDRVYAAGKGLTPDQGGTGTTDGFAAEVIAQLGRGR